MAYKSARNKNAQNRNRNKKFSNTNNRKVKPNPRKGGRVTKTTKVLDARQKIIQKKRRNVVDARDILAKMAKTQDARSKLVKMRESKNGMTLNGNVRVIGSSILRKTDRNGKITLVTSKNKQSTSDINLAVQQQLGLIRSNRSPKRVGVKRLVSPVRKVGNFTSPLIRKTILNDLEYAAAYNDLAQVYDEPESMYRWVKPGLKSSSSTVMSRRPLHVTTRNELADRVTGEWRPYSSMSTRSMRIPSAYIDLDAMDNDDIPVAPVRQTISLQGSSRISNVHSRLDGMPAQPQTHGILAQTKTKVVVPAGHRIVVSNLQSSVTQDDIKELFEDIGQLLVARLVRPGTAEVIYKNLKDAQKAVDTYHNRQLDGQPMKCLLVNKRPFNNPTGPALATGTSEGILSVPRKPNVSAAKLVPDISTIHKVLFQRK